MIDFRGAVETVRAQWSDYDVADYGFDGGDDWFVLLLPETAGGRIAAVDKATAEIRWINENADEYTEEIPVGG